MLLGVLNQKTLYASLIAGPYQKQLRMCEPIIYLDAFATPPVPGTAPLTYRWEFVSGEQVIPPEAIIDSDTPNAFYDGQIYNKDARFRVVLYPETTSKRSELYYNVTRTPSSDVPSVGSQDGLSTDVISDYTFFPWIAGVTTDTAGLYTLPDLSNPLTWYQGAVPAGEQEYTLTLTVPVAFPNPVETEGVYYVHSYDVTQFVNGEWIPHSTLPYGTTVVTGVHPGTLYRVAVRYKRFDNWPGKDQVIQGSSDISVTSEIIAIDYVDKTLSAVGSQETIIGSEVVRYTFDTTTSEMDTAPGVGTQLATTSSNYARFALKAIGPEDATLSVAGAQHNTGFVNIVRSSGGSIGG